MNTQLSSQIACEVIYRVLELFLKSPMLKTFCANKQTKNSFRMTWGDVNCFNVRGGVKWTTVTELKTFFLDVSLSLAYTLHSFSHVRRNNTWIIWRFQLLFSWEMAGAMPFTFGENFEAIRHKSVHNNKMVALRRVVKERQQLLL